MKNILLLFFFLFLFSTGKSQMNVKIIIDTRYTIGDFYTTNNISKIQYFNGIETITLTEFTYNEKGEIVIEFETTTEDVSFEVFAVDGDCFAYSFLVNDEYKIQKNQVCDYLNFSCLVRTGKE